MGISWAKFRRVRLAGRVVAFLIVVFVFAATIITHPGQAGAELPPPQWMPNSPILAGNQVIILWLPVPGAVKYNIYVNGKKVAEAVGVQHIMPAPEEAGEYKIQLSSVDASGKEGKLSSPGIIKIITIEPPRNLVYRLAGKKVLLRWDKAKGAVIYNVYRADKKGGEFKLIASVQAENYADSSVEEGKKYYYAVTSKDLAGKESKKSQVLEVSLIKRKVKEAVNIVMKVVPSKEVKRILLIGKNKVQMYGGFKIGPDGYGYMVDSGRAKVLKIDFASEEVVATIGEAGVGEGKLSRPAGIAFASDGRIFLADYKGKVVVYSSSGKFLYEIKLDPPDPQKDAIIYDNAIPNAKGEIPHPSGLLIDEESDTLYVAVPRYNTIYTFTLDGKFKGYFGHGGKGELALANPTELLFNADKTEMIITEPPAHRVAVIDMKEKKRKFTIGEIRKGFIGGFIGINGATVTPNGNYLFCDSSVHSIQVFDGKKYNYLYHIGGENPMADPEFKERAKFDFPYPVGANFDKEGRLYIVNGLKRYISVREVYWDKATEIK